MKSICFVLLFLNIRSIAEIECLVEALFDHIAIDHKAYENLKKFHQEKDFDVKIDFEKMKTYQLLYEIDFNTKNELEQILINF